MEKVLMKVRLTREIACAIAEIFPMAGDFISE